MTAKIVKYQKINSKLKKTSGIFVINGEIVEKTFKEDQYQKIKDALEHYNRRPSKKRFDSFEDSFFTEPEIVLTKKETKRSKSIELKLTEISKKYPLVYKSGKIQLKGVNVSMPKVLESKIIKSYKNGKDLKSLINFWRLLLLNPNPASRESMYKYVEGNDDFTITPNGYVLMYRRVKLKTGATNDLYPEYIPEMYLKAKAQKKSPAKLVLMQKPEYRDTLRLHSINAKTDSWIDKGYELLHNGEMLDVLYEKYKNSSDKPVYTCARQGDATHGTTIIMGEPVTMPRELCDNDVNQTCSRGLHLGSIGWVGTGYSRSNESTNAGFGDHLIACLLNPRDAVAVPYVDAYKMRCCKYFPFAVVTGKTAHEVKNMNLSQFDSDYKDIEDNEIDELLSNYKNLKASDYINNNLNLTNIKAIIKARIE